nr:unnamed protein product [Spirometra erinaceieuropaei]
MILAVANLPDALGLTATSRTLQRPMVPPARDLLTLTARSLHQYNVDVCCLSEVRLPDSGSHEIKIPGVESHFALYHSGPRDSSGRHGVAIALSQQAELALLAWKLVNDRMAYVRLKGHFTSISIVAVYAPTSAAEQRDKEAFYSQLQALVERLPRRHLLIVAGDWNGRTGPGDPTTSHLLGRFGLGSRCEYEVVTCKIRRSSKISSNLAWPCPRLATPGYTYKVWSGLPKVHKEAAPLRPIVSLKDTPTYGLARWLYRRLKFLTTDSDTTVCSSTQFLEKLKGISLLPNDVMDLAIETVQLLLRNKYDETENRLGHAQVLQLLKFCLRTYFTFDGTIYEQVKGTLMGSPISGFIAEAVLQQLESLVFQHHRPKFWARYVDDTFVVIERDQVLTFKERLNSVFPDIQFTMEEKENNQPAFLYVLVCRKDCGGLKTKVFRKITNTTQILNFNSNHPICHKRSCVRTLFRRVETHCSEPEDKVAESQYLRRVFRVNGYPRNFVNQCLRKRDERQNRADPKVWRAIPYIKNVSEVVSRLLVPLGVVVAHRLEVTMRRQVMKPKDPLPRQETSGVVYRIWCSCGQSNFVGETGRLLRTRIAEHVAAVRRNDANSQVAAHSTRPGHTFKFDEAEILARGDNRVSRELLESWFTGPQSINKCNDIPTPYSVLRHRLAKAIDHSSSAQAREPDGRAIITPASNTGDEFSGINNLHAGHQAISAPAGNNP